MCDCSTEIKWPIFSPLASQDVPPIPPPHLLLCVNKLSNYSKLYCPGVLTPSQLIFLPPGGLTLPPQGLQPHTSNASSQLLPNYWPLSTTGNERQKINQEEMHFLTAATLLGQHNPCFLVLQPPASLLTKTQFINTWGFSYFYFVSILFKSLILFFGVYFLHFASLTGFFHFILPLPFNLLLPFHPCLKEVSWFPSLPVTSHHCAGRGDIKLNVWLLKAPLKIKTT